LSSNALYPGARNRKQGAINEKKGAKNMSLHASRCPLQELRTHEDRQQMITRGRGEQVALFVAKPLDAAARKISGRIFISETHGMAQRGGNETNHRYWGRYCRII
jgi:hypothetical protein